jgi:hypothetical protein
MKPKVILILLIIVVSMLMMTSCQDSIFKIGYRCFNGPQKLDCKYQRFTGREVVKGELQPGENIELSYEVDVRSGILSIQVVALDEKVLWTSKFSESSMGEAIISTDWEGLYQMIVQGDGTRGGFLMEWSIQSPALR